MFKICKSTAYLGGLFSKNRLLTIFVFSVSVIAVIWILCQFVILGVNITFSNISMDVKANRDLCLIELNVISESQKGAYRFYTGHPYQTINTPVYYPPDNRQSFWNRRGFYYCKWHTSWSGTSYAIQREFYLPLWLLVSTFILLPAVPFFISHRRMLKTSRRGFVIEAEKK